MKLFSFAPPVRPLLTNSLGGLKASCLFFDFSNVDHSVISAAAVVSFLLVLFTCSLSFSSSSHSFDGPKLSFFRIS